MECVRHLPVVALAAVLAALIAVAQAELVRVQLAEVPSNARVRLDPLGTATGALALVATIAVYFGLGRVLARRGVTPGNALYAGLIAGVIGGIVGGIAQAHGVEGYLGRALGRVYLPPWFLSTVLGLYAALLTLFGGLVGAVSAWFGARAAPSGAAATRR